MEPNEPGSDLRNALAAITSRIIGAALEIHEKYGPVMLEKAYQDCMCIEFEFLRIPFESQVSQSIDHEAQVLTYMKLRGCRAGLLINFRSVPLTDLQFSRFSRAELFPQLRNQRRKMK